MINNPNNLFLCIIYFNPSYNGGKFLIPNKFGEGVFYWSEEKQKVVNGSDRPGLIVGVGNYDSQILPIQTQHASNYGSNYNDGKFILLNLNELLKNSLKNNSVLHTNNYVKISNKLLLDAINNKKIFYKKIFVDDFNNKNSLLPLEILWDTYKNYENDRDLISISEIKEKNFGTKEETKIINDLEFKYKLISDMKWCTENQVDKVFGIMNSQNRAIVQTPEFYKNVINEKRIIFEREFNSSKTFFNKVFVNYIDKNKKNKKWLSLINNDSKFKNLWCDYNNAKDFINPYKNINKNINSKNKEREK